VAEYDFPLSQAAAALAAWRDLSAQAPRQATFTASVSGDLLTAGFVWTGDPRYGRELLPLMGALGQPAAERLSEPTYLELQRRDDSVQRHARRRYWKGHYLRGVPGGGDRGVPAARDPRWQQRLPAGRLPAGLRRGDRRHAG
jgi:hypothetical protein